MSANPLPSIESQVLSRDLSTSTASSRVDASELDPLSRRSRTTEQNEICLGMPPVEPGADSGSRKGLSLGRRFPRLSRWARKSIIWIRGPSPPEVLQPTSLLNRSYKYKSISFSTSIESRWIRWTRRLSNNLPLLVILGIAYIISLSFLVRANWYLVPSDAFVGCTATFWSAKDGCGLDGSQCQPFTSDSPMDFRCPAQCLSTQLLNIRTVGDQQVIYQPLVVGGGDANQTYRGDTWLCAAAIQSGIVSNSNGGCASVSLVGSFTSFLGRDDHRVSSISFPSEFPLSYRLSSSNSLSHCTDLRSYALILNALVTAFLFLVLRPKPLVLFWCLVCIGYWHITFFSDPRSEPPPISDAFGTFLPTLFVAYAFWLHAFKHTMPAFDQAPWERMFLYLFPYWIGVYFNETFAKLPVDRLIPSDIAKQPGAIPVVIVLGLLVLAIVINQVRVIRKVGWLGRYLMYYITGGLVIMVLALLPTLTLRLHHYIIPIVLIGGTAFPTRLSAIYQALLLGMCLNGLSRWGFDSILQTADELRRDAPLGSSLPEFLTNSSNPLSSIASNLTWQSVEAMNTKSEGWNGFALLVDDVERYAGNALNFSLSQLNLSSSVPHFFRLAYQRDGVSGDFTQAAVWYPNGTFIDPPPGPS
ncbi:hypothetical protein M407DRAFT_211832 [Tulasnella calospora MUT 4182]|uniref:LCCL domain-containing protein n=1 Tax=Tulasnella calospora MUT 4182 TaxID=1051891 RepID=A0A0C3QFK8_9AGAM|nr:hypothetical protein M407DRAFT_211832 [Tulasnella calospora MUT 4182]